MPRSPENYELLRGIREYPQDLGRRLIYADWVEEHGDPKRAEFMRLHIGRATARRERWREIDHELQTPIPPELIRWLSGGYADVYFSELFEQEKIVAIGLRQAEGYAGDYRLAFFNDPQLGTWNIEWWAGFFGTVELNIHSFLSYAGLLAAHAPIETFKVKGFSVYESLGDASDPSDPARKCYRVFPPEPKTTLLKEYDDFVAQPLLWRMLNSEITAAALEQHCQAWAQKQAEVWLERHQQ